jgi:hypothetical protein
VSNDYMMEGSSLPHDSDTNLLWLTLTSRHWLPAVSAADECGIFSALGLRPLGAAELAERSGLDLRAVRALLSLLTSIGFLKHRDEQFYLQDTVRRHLLDNSSHYWGAVLRAEGRNDPMHIALVTRLRQIRTHSSPETRRQPFNHWERGAIDPDFAARIARFMHPLSLSEAPFVACHSCLDGTTRILDVGGGDGTLAIEIARGRPAVHCTVMDLDGMCMQASELIAAAGIGDKVDTHACDMFREPWPQGYDCVILSNVLHDWSENECEELLHHAYEALPCGGQLLIHEALLDEDGTGPLIQAGLSVRMLLDTRGQQFSHSALRKLIERAGFVGTQNQKVSALYSLVSARKAL